MTQKRMITIAVFMLSSATYATYAWTQSAPAPGQPKSPGGVPAPARIQAGRGAMEPMIGHFGPTYTPGVPMGMGMGMGMTGAPSPKLRPRYVSQPVTTIVYDPISVEEQREIEQFQEALKELKESKDEAGRKKAAEDLHVQILKQFERDVVRREQELAAVEERVKTLRLQLDKRKASKDEIVGLRLKTVVNNADGLGFPGDDASAQFDTPGGPGPEGIGFGFPVVRPPFGGGGGYGGSLVPQAGGVLTPSQSEPAIQFEVAPERSTQRN